MKASFRASKGVRPLCAVVRRLPSARPLPRASPDVDKRGGEALQNLAGTGRLEGLVAKQQAMAGGRPFVHERAGNPDFVDADLRQLSVSQQVRTGGADSWREITLVSGSRLR